MLAVSVGLRGLVRVTRAPLAPCICIGIPFISSYLLKTTFKISLSKANRMVFLELLQSEIRLRLIILEPNESVTAWAKPGKGNNSSHTPRRSSIKPVSRLSTFISPPKLVCCPQVPACPFSSRRRLLPLSPSSSSGSCQENRQL
jgi:hypothetical protein